MHILIATDTLVPDINGVARTLDNTIKCLEKDGHQVNIICPSMFNKIKCPFYPEVKLSYCRYGQIKKYIKKIRPDCIHISTEGPIGFNVRRFCVRNKIPFTTSYHTKFPEYIKARIYFPLNLSYQYFRWFHKAAVATLVATESLKIELEKYGFTNLHIWSRGVDTDLFHPININNQQPIWLYVGRVAVEKNLEAFLSLHLPGKKVIVGDGPDLSDLKELYPHIQWAGYKQGKDLVEYYQKASVFVFPSKTDTFGLVMLEANACGVPVAAYPVTGPIDIIQNGINGYLDNDLQSACYKALEIDRIVCRIFAETKSWEVCTQEFLNILVKFDSISKLLKAD